jgi:outer membrane murein-binding lipoprotein Lpp
MKSISSKVETIDRKIDAIEDDVKDLRHKTAV